MPSSVVCISGQDGSGARETAEAVAAALGFRTIDESIVARAALQAGVDKQTIADVERHKSRLQSFIEGLGATGGGGDYIAPETVAAGPASEELRGLIRAVIEDTAERGDAVIVSHAASLALAGRDGVLRVLLTAPSAVREERVAQAAGLDADEAARVVKRGDAARADYIKRFYGVNSELGTHYDLVINTEQLTPQRAAELIVLAAG